MNSYQQQSGRIWLPIIFALVIGLAGGFLISNYTTPGKNGGVDSNDGQQAEQEVLYWVAPMDPTYRRDEPGKSPMGMDLVPVYAQQEREAEILYWVAPMDPDYRRDGPGKSPMGMDLVPVYADATVSTPEDSKAVRIGPIVEHNLGVRTSTAERRSLWRKVEATGYIGFDESRLSQINVRTEGWVQRLLVETEGERVTKGQLLFEFYSPELLNAQKEYIQAKRRNESRLTLAARNKLLALGMDAADFQRLDQTGKVSETSRVLAPQDGIITRLHIKEGIFIKPATEVMSLADLSSVWLRAGVFESQAEWVIPGQSAEARLSYMPGEVFSGRVDYVYPILDPVTRTLQVRLRFDNPGERMKPNMYARVTIYGKSHPGALSIPKEALIRGERYDRVVVSLGDGTYVVREVVSGIESGAWVEIKSGIEAGDEVVISAQFLIDSEASMAGSIRRLDASGMMGRATDGGAVLGNGIVEAVDVQARKIRVSHGPIEDLGWSAMTMEFDVLPGVDLGLISIGQNIRFSLHPSEVGDYQINIIRQGEATP